MAESSQRTHGGLEGGRAGCPVTRCSGGRCLGRCSILNSKSLSMDDNGAFRLERPRAKPVRAHRGLKQPAPQPPSLRRSIRHLHPLKNCMRPGTWCWGPAGLIGSRVAAVIIASTTRSSRRRLRNGKIPQRCLPLLAFLSVIISSRAEGNGNMSLFSRQAPRSLLELNELSEVAEGRQKRHMRPPDFATAGDTVLSALLIGVAARDHCSRRHLRQPSVHQSTKLRQGCASMHVR